MNEKLCKYCNEIKTIENFSRNKLIKDGFLNKCKDCERIYRINNQKHIKERNKKYIIDNNECLKEKSKKYRTNNKENISKQKKEYYLNNKEKIKTYGKRWIKDNKERNKKVRHEKYLRNKDKVIQYARDYRKKNIDKVREYHRNYVKNKRATNPHYAIQHRLRNRLIVALRKHKGKKQASLVELVGCNLEQLKLHIENQFTNTMNWQEFFNGNIVIDHIKPCCSFDLTKLEEQKACFHYTNLQPLWEKDNRSKLSQDIKLKI